MWIPTGSRWLDSIIAKPDISGTKRAGIPMGKIVEIAGLESCVTEDTEIEVLIEED
jgi:hypothetical protein